MSIKDVIQVLAMPRTGLLGADFPVLVVLAWHKNEHTGICEPGYKTLAREACVSTDTVGRSVANLKTLGFLDYQAGKGNTSNQYVLHIPTSDGTGSQPIRYGPVSYTHLTLPTKRI